MSSDKPSKTFARSRAGLEAAQLRLAVFIACFGAGGLPGYLARGEVLPALVSVVAIVFGVIALRIK